MGRAVTWSSIERAAWKPTDKISVSEWCERSIVLDASYAAEAGPLNLGRTPYTREILDSFAEPSVGRITLMMGTQVGKTQTWLNMMAFGIAQKPAPAMLVMPGEEDAKQMIGGRLKALVEASPELAKHMGPRSNDWRESFVQFDLSVIYAAWANSPRALAGRPVCYVFFDEVDKFPPWSGKEADPVSLGEERARTYQKSRRAKIVLTSTPTTREGYISKEFDQSDRRRFYVPCPFCGKFQRLELRGIKFDGARDPKAVRAEQAMTYECAGCTKRIGDDHKPKMLARGVWVPEGAEIKPDGTLANAPRISPHRGYHLNALYSPWLSWSDIAAKFLEANAMGTAKLMNFVNSWLAEPWEEKSEVTDPEKLAALAEDHEAGTVPTDAVVLVAGADVQKDLIYFTVRAFGYGERSWHVLAGRVEGWDQLRDQVLDRVFPVIGRPNDSMQVRMLCIDSQGHRTDEVYRFYRENGDRVRPIKGEQRLSGIPTKHFPITRTVDGESVAGMRTHVDTTYFKDKLHRMMHAQPGAQERWGLHREPAEEYLRQVTNEQRVLEVNRKTGQETLVWRERPGAGHQTHWWDCEVYALAAAYILGVHAWKPTDAMEDRPVAGQSISDRRPDRRAARPFGGRPRRAGVFR